MRRITTALTAATAALALAACNGDTTTEDATTPDATVPAVETETETGAAGATDDTTDAATQTDAAGQTGDAAADTGAATGAAAGGMTDQVCADFFEGQGTPLAERVPEQLDAVSGGADLDPVSFSEVSLLEGRVGELVDDASADQQGLLERINAPLTEVVQAVVGEGTMQEETITIPEVDTQDAQDALEEFETACS